MGSHKKHRKRSRSSSEEKERRRSQKKHKKVHESSSDSSSSSSSSDTSDEERRQRQKRAKKHKKKMMDVKKAEKVKEESCDIPISLMEKSKQMAPMTKEEWEKQQSVIRRIYDPTSGRHRLIKGDGEVLEEIVSKDRHKEINRQATQGDGQFFQSQTMKK